MLKILLKKLSEKNNTQKIVPEKDQDLVDSTESHKSMPCFVFDASAEFGNNNQARVDIIDSESESGGINVNITQGSAVSTFVTSKTKAKGPTMAEGSDDVSTFTHATYDAYESRIIEIESQIDEFKADIKS